ncbi:hypothetical protein [Phormidium sp. FACHB-592]|uniref:Uncharacterized protein n=1 Tax=Stenomitos frigidus AS-A4 TaxID=2933935 RepID=A0ABV0KS27_9CYAN|nr:hypothetical protein [Phormidium sp. FACHB-592]
MGLGGARSLPLALWRFCARAATSMPPQQHGLSQTELRATVEAIAQQEERCALTGQRIHPQQPM